MNMTAFEDLLDRFGADPARWPPEQRSDATALLAGSANAREQHAAMASVEAVLGRTSAAAPPADFAAVAMHRPQARRVSPLMRNTRWGAAVAAALVLGILVGTTGFDTGEISPDQVVASALDAHGSADVD